MNERHIGHKHYPNACKDPIRRSKPMQVIAPQAARGRRADGGPALAAVPSKGGEGLAALLALGKSLKGAK